MKIWFKLLIINCLLVLMALKPAFAQDGIYLMKAEAENLGEMEFYAKLDFSGGRLFGNSVGKADGKARKFADKTGGRLFDTDYPHGSLVGIYNGKTESRQDTLFFEAKFASAVFRNSLRGKFFGGKGEGEVLDGKKQPIGQFSFHRAENTPTLRAYKSIVRDLIEVTEKHAFYPALRENKNWIQFKKEFPDKVLKFKDDAEFIYALAAYTADLPFGPLFLHGKRSRPPGTEPYGAYRSPSAFILKPGRFLESEPESPAELIRREFKARPFKNLVLDLRQTGGSLPGFLSYLAAFSEQTGKAAYLQIAPIEDEISFLPGPAGSEFFPIIDIAEEDKIYENLGNKRGIYLFQKADNEAYTGNLYILTDENTNGTAAVLSAVLGQKKNVVRVGELPDLSGFLQRRIAVGPFFFALSVADIRQADGKDFDAESAKPDFAARSSESLRFVFEKLIR